MLSMKFSVSTILAALALAGVAHAEVTPSEPGPGQVYNAGSTCTVSWEGDKESTTAWKNMNIQLMTGDNYAMVHLTTIATDEDGTVDGRVNYPCPEVTINSNIYFYQFTAPGAPNKTWTTRFTIASATGATVPPPNANQPGTNDPVPWGTGALSDPSKAVPAPASAGGSGAAASGSASASGTNTATGTTSSTSTVSSKAAGSSSSTSSASKATGTSNTTATANVKDAENGAMGRAGMGVVLGSVVAAASSALALALSL